MAKLHWASLGTGVIANELAEALAGRGDVLYSVANRTYDKAVAFAEKYGVSKVYDNMEEIPNEVSEEELLDRANNPLHIL